VHWFAVTHRWLKNQSDNARYRYRKVDTSSCQPPILSDGASEFRSRFAVTGIEQSMAATCTPGCPTEGVACLRLAPTTEFFNLGGYSDLAGTKQRTAPVTSGAALSVTISEHVRERAGDFGCELTKLIEWNHRARVGREHAEEQSPRKLLPTQEKL
jgi:hypothetical protein